VATTLTWGRGKFVKTVALDRFKNVAIMTTKPGIKKCTAFAAKVTSLEPNICCFVATGAPQPSVPDVTDDDDDASSESTVKPGHESDSDESTHDADVTSRTTLSVTSGAKIRSTLGTTSDATSEMKKGLKQINFQDQPNIPGLSVERDDPLKIDQEELYRLHVRMGHLPFSKLRAMARRGDVVPGRLQHCMPPICAAYQYSKATRKPWRTKKKNREIKRAKRPGECVSVDQVESRVVGFVAQLKGRLT
jgi:hypothetical protein